MKIVDRMLRARKMVKEARRVADLCRRFQTGMKSKGETRVASLKPYEILIGYRDLVVAAAHRQGKKLTDAEIEEAMIKALEATVYAIEHDDEPPALIL